jgi:putative ABC transport system substrate-binding protein
MEMAVKRSLFLRVAAIGLCAGPLAALAQPEPQRLRRVGILVQGPSPEPGAKPGAFRRTMRELGYVEGQNLVLDFRGADGDNTRFPFLASEIIAQKPDVIVAETTPGALAAKRATASIPIVIFNVSDPVGSGLVASLARPGGNVTGATDFGMELTAKSVELLKGIVPNLRRLGVLMSDNPVHQLQLKEVRTTANQLGLSALSFTMTSGDRAEAAFSAMHAEHVDAFVALGGAPFDSTKAQRELLIRLAAKARIPGIYASRAMVDLGGLMSYGIDNGASWKITAPYVADILKGARPAEMPVQQPKEFELFINTRTAASLGLTIPPAMLMRAELVHE